MSTRIAAREALLKEARALSSAPVISKSDAKKIDVILSQLAEMRLQDDAEIKHNNHREELRNYIVTDRDPRKEVRTAFDTTSAAGLIPQLFIDGYRTHLTSFNAWQRAGSTVVPTGTSGADAKVPVLNDLANLPGIVLVENSQLTTTIPAFESVTLKGFPYHSGGIQASIELLQDSAVDIVNMVQKALAVRIGTVTQAAFTNGITNGDSSLLSALTVGVTTAGTNTTPPSLTELTNMIATISPAYLGDAAWMMHPTIKAQMAALTASSLRLYPEITDDGKLLGYPIVLNTDCPSAFATNSLTMLFGSFSEGINIRDTDPAFTVNTQSRAEFGAVVYSILHRQSAKLVNSDAVKVLKQHV
jgi:HK97 family phage major capsid protein